MNDMFNKKKKVLISTMGPLHLIKAAEYLQDLVDLRVVQGWIPNKWTKWMIKPISRIIGRDLSKTIIKRTPHCLEGRNHGLLLPELLNNLGRLIVKNTKWRTFLAIKSHSLYGVMSEKYVRDIDILHVRSGSGLRSIKKAKKRGIKVLVDHSIAHPYYIREHLSEEFKKYNISIEKAFPKKMWDLILEDCWNTDILLVNSDFVKNTFVQYGYDSRKIYVVTQGVRDDFFNLKNEYSIRGTMKILFTGGFGFRKGAEYILRACQVLDSMDFDYELIVVGDHTEGKELVKNIPIKNIKLVGFLPQVELKQYLKSSDIYLFPSLVEGCASSGLEAMAAGLPVIATYESGLPIRDGENGIIISSKNVDQIVENILYLAKYEDVRKKFGQNAAQLISTEYTWTKYANKVEYIYNIMTKS